MVAKILLGLISLWIIFYSCKYLIASQIYLNIYNSIPLIECNNSWIGAICSIIKQKYFLYSNYSVKPSKILTIFGCDNLVKYLNSVSVVWSV